MYNPREENLTEGPLFRQIVRFSLPLVLSNMLQVFFNMSDIAVVGRFAGARALGAVGSTAILVTLFTGQRNQCDCGKISWSTGRQGCAGSDPYILSADDDYRTLPADDRFWILRAAAASPWDKR